MTSTSSSATGCRRWKADIAPYREAGTVDVGANEPGRREIHARGEQAAGDGPRHCKDFADIAAHAGRARTPKIYGIEPGNDGNRLIHGHDRRRTRSGSKASKLSRARRPGMLAQVARADKQGEPIVFLGWEPHPMNANFEMGYLDRRRRLVRPGFRRRHGGRHQYPRGLCRLNVRTSGQTAQQSRVFSLAMENEIMGAILNDGEDPSRCRESLAGRQPRRLGWPGSTA